MKKTGCMVAGLLALGACSPVPSNSAAPGGAPKVSGPDTCNASAYTGMIGQDAVVALSIPDPKRSYRTGEPVTQDFNAQRVNIVLDETDVIIGISCG